MALHPGFYHFSELLSSSIGVVEHKIARTPDAKFLDQEAYNRGLARVGPEFDRMLIEQFGGMSDYSLLADYIHRYSDVLRFYTRTLVHQLVTGKPVDTLIDREMAHLKVDQPWNYAMMLRTLPLMLEELGIPMQARWKEAVMPPQLLIIDDTLNMDLLARNIDTNPNRLFNQAENYPHVFHVRDEKDATELAPGLHPAAVICDYNLKRPNEEGLNGPDLLEKLYPDPANRPTLFISSKTPFTEDEIAQLRARGMHYVHANEIYAMAAAETKDAYNLAFNVQSAKTTTLREWVNLHWDADYPTSLQQTNLNLDAKPNSLTVDEVVAGLINKSITQQDAYRLLDYAEIDSAWNVEADLSQLEPSQILELVPAVEGPSVTGRLAQREDINSIATRFPDEPIILVLDRDYTSDDNDAIAKSKGVILLGRGMEHLDIYAKSLQIPVAYALDPTKLRYGRTAEGELVMPFAESGNVVTFDGQQALLCKGEVPLVFPNPKKHEAIKQIAAIAANHTGLNWHVPGGKADESGMRVLMNIEKPEQFAKARMSNWPYQGIGLYRTETDFMSFEGRDALASAIQPNPSAQELGCWSISRTSNEQFAALFSHTGGMARVHQPVTIRLFDFSPDQFFAPGNAVPRGAAFGTAYPHIYETQLEALFETARTYYATPRIMVPNVTSIEEVIAIKAMVEKVAAKHHMQGRYAFGVMLETRELALTGEDTFEERRARDNLKRLAPLVDFATVGSNDLTSRLLPLPRGDKVAMERWQHENSIPYNPFHQLAPRVKAAIQRTVQFLHQEKPALPIGICGQHAESVKDIPFFQQIGLASLSVNASEESICRTMIHAGHAALEAYIKADETRVNAKLDESVPDGIVIPSPAVFQQAKSVCIYVEDGVEWIRGATRLLKNQPVAICPTITQALDLTARLWAQSKRVTIVTDMEVPLGRPQDAERLAKTHAWLNDMPIKGKWGVSLAEAIRRGEVPGIESSDVAVLSGGVPAYYGLSKAVHFIDKGTGSIRAITDFMDSRRAPIAQSGRGQG